MLQGLLKKKENMSRCTYASVGKEASIFVDKNLYARSISTVLIITFFLKNNF